MTRYFSEFIACSSTNNVQLVFFSPLGSKILYEFLHTLCRYYQGFLTGSHYKHHECPLITQPLLKVPALYIVE
ncbi:hypothetical protein RY27_24720 [Litorilinea aerophila]|nr:hypothetical protein RY27_24720 [Litorilinea aerophila]